MVIFLEIELIIIQEKYLHFPNTLKGGAEVEYRQWLWFSHKGVE